MTCRLSALKKHIMIKIFLSQWQHLLKHPLQEIVLNVAQFAFMWLTKAHALKRETCFSTGHHGGRKVPLFTVQISHIHHIWESSSDSTGIVIVSSFIQQMPGMLQLSLTVVLQDCLKYSNNYLTKTCCQGWEKLIWKQVAYSWVCFLCYLYASNTILISISVE